MRDLENQDYLNIIKSDCVRITDIRTEDDLKLSLGELDDIIFCLLYTSPSPRDA